MVRLALIEQRVRTGGNLIIRRLHMSRKLSIHLTSLLVINAAFKTDCVFCFTSRYIGVCYYRITLITINIYILFMLFILVGVSLSDSQNALYLASSNSFSINLDPLWPSD